MPVTTPHRRRPREAAARPARALVAGLAAAAMLALAPGAASASTQDAGRSSVTVHQGVFDSPSNVRHSSETVSAAIVRTPVADKAEQQPAPAPQQKLHPAIAEELQAAGERSDKRLRVLIRFAEDQRIPPFPEPVTALPRSATPNVVARAAADALVETIKAERAGGYRRIRGDLQALGGKVLTEFWLIKGVLAEVPVSALPVLELRSDVQYIEPDDTAAAPPDADPDNDVADARGLMRTDPYFALNQTAGWIGLLDTGVRATHTLFNSPSHLAIREDLTTTTNPNPDDDCWNHGTSSAAILTGNGALGDAFRGVTAISVDSFKVYPAGCGGLSGSAAVAGFQRAVNVLDRVIVAEMQAGGSETSSISAAADSAFDAGAVVIAANGNNGPNAGTVNVPGNAQKALGIGAVDVKSLATPDYQSRGPASDGRIKPDIQAPTNVDTASSSSSTATRPFGGTSAATPHAAGAAALVRNFLRGGTGDIHPGDVYAYMIMSGSQPYPFNNTTGAGRVRLPVNGQFWRGSVTIGHQQTIDIPIGVNASTGLKLNAGLWWPEAPATHNDVDLSLVDPAGSVRASSLSAASVFERVSVTGPIAGGTWKLRIRGYSVPSGGQQVFFAGATTP